MRRFIDSFRRNNSPDTLPVDKFALTAFAFLTILVAVLGGSSRYDAIQLIVLQPASCLLVGAVLYRMDLKDLAPVTAPLLFVTALALIMLFQLVPLPANWWSGIPGRQDLFALSEVLQDTSARPLSMAPWRTLNSLFNLSILLSGILVFSLAKESCVKFVVVAIVILSLSNSVLGLIQLLSDHNDFFYFYEHTNSRAPVGIFANRNHSSTFSAVSMVVISASINLRKNIHGVSGIKVVLWTAYFVIFLVSLMNGSRAGLVSTAIALVATLAIIATSSQSDGIPDTGRAGKNVLIFVGVAMLISFVFLVADRLPGISRFIDRDPLSDLRFTILPTLIQMIRDYLPFGSGFGSFEGVYYMHEDERLLTRSYLNQADNDWLQFVIEAGALGILLLLAFFAWTGRAIANLAFRSRSRAIAVAAFAVVIIVSFASFVDYPLRVPTFQLTIVWLIASLAVMRTRLAN